MKSKLLLLFFWCFLTGNGDASVKPHVSAALISEMDAIEPGKPFWVAVQLKMDRGWHTYWKNPGDAGMATAIKWSLPHGFRSGSVQWPYPKKFGEAPAVSYGYENEVMLPVQIETPATLKNGEQVTLSAQVRWLECADVCLPGKAELKLNLPVKPNSQVSRSKAAPLFNETRLKLPVKNSDWKVKATSTKDKIKIVLAPSKAQISELEFFPEDQGLIDSNSPQKFHRNGEGYHLELQKADLESVLPSSIKGVLVFKDAESKLNSAVKAVEINAQIER